MRVKRKSRKTRSLFSTKTARGLIIGYLTTLTYILVEAYYANGLVAKDALAIVVATGALAQGLDGRMRINDQISRGTVVPVTTPEFLPGASKEDFEVEDDIGQN